MTHRHGLSRKTKRRNPYAKALFDRELPFGHKVEHNKKAYKRRNKHRKNDYESGDQDY